MSWFEFFEAGFEGAYFPLVRWLWPCCFWCLGYVRRVYQSENLMLYVRDKIENDV
jgi:hypothetical protein